MRKVYSTYYEVFQLLPEADQEVIDAVYRRLCKKYHPDTNPDVDSEKDHFMKQLTEAYAVLGEPQKRERYNQILSRSKVEGGMQNRDHGSGLEGNFNTPNNQNAWGDSKAETAAEKALAVVSAYFAALSEQRPHLAYQLLCSEDQKKIPLKDFIEWQEAVEQLYTLGDVSVSVFRSHVSMDANSGDLRKTPVSESLLKTSRGRQTHHAGTEPMQYTEWLEVLVEGREIDMVQDTLSPVHLIKMVVKEKKDWRLRLGYDEVRGLTAKFRLMAESKHPRVVDEEELQNLARHEEYRFNRFKIPFSLVVLSVSSVSKEPVAPGLWEAKVFNWISRSMDVLRLTDVLARLESGECMLLLPHTDTKQADIALTKLSDIIKKLASDEGASAAVSWIQKEAVV